MDAQSAVSDFGQNSENWPVCVHEKDMLGPQSPHSAGTNAMHSKRVQTKTVRGGRYWDRTSDHHNVNVVLYR